MSVECLKRLKDQDMPDQTELLANAAETGAEETVKRIIEGTPGSDRYQLINCLKYDKPTPLTLAAMNGHLPVVKLLVEEYQADIDRLGRMKLFGKTVQAPPLICATASNNTTIVRYLLSKGADVNCTTANKSTALMYACIKGSEDIVAVLMEARCDKDYLNKWKNNALMIAAMEGQTNLVEMLSKKGVDVDWSNIHGMLFCFVFHLQCMYIELHKERHNTAKGHWF